MAIGSIGGGGNKGGGKGGGGAVGGGKGGGGDKGGKGGGGGEGGDPMQMISQIIDMVKGAAESAEGKKK